MFGKLLYIQKKLLALIQFNAINNQALWNKIPAEISSYIVKHFSAVWHDMSISLQAVMVDSSLPLYGSASIGGSSLRTLASMMHEELSGHEQDDGSHSDSSLDLSPVSAL